MKPSKCPNCGGTDIISTTCSDQPWAKDVNNTGSIVVGSILNLAKKVTVGNTVPAYKCNNCGLTAPQTTWEKNS